MQIGISDGSHPPFAQSIRNDQFKQELTIFIKDRRHLDRGGREFNTTALKAVLNSMRFIETFRLRKR
jgi:hypothetical protein